MNQDTHNQILKHVDNLLDIIETGNGEIAIDIETDDSCHKDLNEMLCGVHNPLPIPLQTTWDKADIYMKEEDILSSIINPSIFPITPPKNEKDFDNLFLAGEPPPSLPSPRIINRAGTGFEQLFNGETIEPGWGKTRY